MPQSRLLFSEGHPRWRRADHRVLRLRLRRVLADAGWSGEPARSQERVVRIETLRALVELQGPILTEEELSYLGKQYPRCPGRESWDVREYARNTADGAREYRVIRGSSGQDVYRSVGRDRATAVRTALNELESQEKAAPLSGAG